MFGSIYKSINVVAKIVRELQKDLHHYLQPKCAHCHGLKTFVLGSSISKKFGN